MQLLASEEYGLRCLVQVADRAGSRGDPPVSVRAVAEAEGLSDEYTAKLLRSLRLAGLVESTRGASGGYRLARPAREISVWEVLIGLGGDPFPEKLCESFAGRPDAMGTCRCVHSDDCSLRALWSRVGGILRAALGQVSLADLGRGEAPMDEWLGRTLPAAAPSRIAPAMAARPPAASKQPAPVRGDSGGSR